jgi:hypothetical protein
MNERLSFERMITQWGHWCALRKFLRDERRSASYSHFYEESDRRALQELTAGRSFVDHLGKMVKRTVVPGFEKAAELGTVATPGLFFYLHASLKPTPEDWILELAQKEVRGVAQPIKPYDVMHMYNIMDVDEMRMEGGRLAYFRCRVEETNIGGPN